MSRTQLTQEQLFQPLSIAQQWWGEGRPAAVATVIETWGSAPCPVGSHLIIDQHGHFHGSVSGGCVEADVIAEAIDLIATGGQHKILEFGVADTTAWRVGLSCGGRIRILLTPLMQHFCDIQTAVQERRLVMTCCELSSGGQTFIDPEQKNWPVQFDPLIKSALQYGKPFKQELDGKEYFCNIYAPLPRIVIIGAVHIAQTLATTAKLADFDVVIVDPRTAFATEERFGDMNFFAQWPQDYFTENPIDQHTAIAALTHDPKIDDDALIEACRAGAFYVGALGSRKTHAARVARLLGAGINDRSLRSIAAPIGLDIGASTPAEIAIAILAQIISAYRKPQVD